MIENRGNYTLQQQKVLTFLPILPGILSLAGSLSVIYVILKDRRKKLKLVYHRLILGMSVMDVIATGGLTIMNGWAIPVGTERWTATPQGTSEFYGARGTVTTCNFAGMFGTLIVTSVGMYSILLSVYYLLVLQYEKGERWIARYVEPVIHVLAIPLPLIWGAILWHLEYFNPMIGWHGWCWIRDAPHGCSFYADGECDRGEEYLSYGAILFFFGIAGWVVIIVDMILIVLKVRATEKRVVRYQIGDSNDTFKRTRQTGIQALLYIGSYFITIIFTGFWALPISNPTALFTVACLIKITLPMQGFWNALIYMRPYYETYSEQKKKQRSQKEIQQASSDLAAITNNTDGNSCPPSMESSVKATGGEVPPTTLDESEPTFPSSWIKTKSLPRSQKKELSK
jgi:hypothetical protein